MSRTFQTRLDAVERAVATSITGSLAERVQAARRAPPVPTHSTAELRALATVPGTVGRIARGWLRIGFVLADSPKRPVPALDPELVLPQMAGYLYDKPLDFVLFAWDWGQSPALSVVRLPEPFSLVYDSEFGIERWAGEFFEEIGQQVRERGFNGRDAVKAQRHAIVSGHGISKTFTTALLVNWIMTTRPHARGVVTANTAPQLETKTWAEITKAVKRSLFAEWFDITSGRGSMKMTSRDHPEGWRCDAQTSRMENSEAFAGLHAADSTAFYIVDEASAVPNALYEVMQGGLTDGEAMIFSFGNPTRNSGWFFEAFNGQRHRWTTRQVDSREVQITNKAQIAEWVEDYGEDSDFVRIRVKGVFPRASSMQFIGQDLVDEAMRRELPPQPLWETAVVGVDVARFGDDQSVIRTRIGRDARSHPAIRLRGADTMTVASRVAEHINHLRGLGLAVVTFVDGGGVGGGVVDRLRQLGYPGIVDVQFGSKATDGRKYMNKRAEMWGEMREWLRAGGCLPPEDSLASDLTAVEYGFTASDQIQLERKQDMKARGLASPDDADALAVTFAFPVAARLDDGVPAGHQAVREYDPLAYQRGRGHDPFASRAA